MLHCPTNVGRFGLSLSETQKNYFLQSISVSLDFNPKNPSNIILRIIYLLLLEIKRYKLFLIAACKFDIIHYNFGSPLLNWGSLSGNYPKLLHFPIYFYGWLNCLIEVSTFKFLNKLIAVTYQGDDARQGLFLKTNYEHSLYDVMPEEYYSPKSDLGKRKRISKFSDFAHIIYALNPDIMNTLPEKTKFLPYMHVDLNEWSYVTHKKKSEVPPIVHAPSDRRIKRTEKILSALETLSRKGVKFHLRIVEGMEWGEAKKIFEKADLAIDQLFAGWYGSFSVEMMALGKPTICNIRKQDLKLINKEMASELL